jgi:hypothetical protein
MTAEEPPKSDLAGIPKEEPPVSGPAETEAAPPTTDDASLSESKEAPFTYEDVSNRTAELRERLEQHAEDNAAEARATSPQESMGTLTRANTAPTPAPAAKKNVAERFVSAVRGGNFGRGAAVSTVALGATFGAIEAISYFGTGSAASSSTGFAALANGPGASVLMGGLKALGYIEFIVGFPWIVCWVLQQVEKAALTGKINLASGAKSGGGGAAH